MVEEQFYPDWLYKKLIDDDLPWDDQSNLKLDSFTDKYTLHDSFWIGIFYHVAFDQSVTLAFQWDSVWLPEEIKKGASDTDDWLYLFFKIDTVHEITTTNFENLGCLINRSIDQIEILTLDGKFYLAIDDVYGGQVNIVLSGGHSILALNPDGSKLEI